MTNVHAPQRLDGESMADYRARRIQSNREAARSIHGWRTLGHRPSQQRQERRALVKVHGRRQALKQIKHDRATRKLEAAIADGEARGYVAHDAA